MSKLVIHLIDDNEIDLSINSKLLEFAKIGDEIIHYSSAALFLEALEKGQSTFSSNRNVVLLDIMMPGMNGFDCMEKFNKLPAAYLDAFEVYMLSSSIDRHDIKNAEKTPRVRQVLEKPLDLYVLRRLLNQ